MAAKRARLGSAAGARFREPDRRTGFDRLRAGPSANIVLVGHPAGAAGRSRGVCLGAAGRTFWRAAGARRRDCPRRNCGVPCDHHEAVTTADTLSPSNTVLGATQPRGIVAVLAQVEAPSRSPAEKESASHGYLWAPGPALRFVMGGCRAAPQARSFLGCTRVCARATYTRRE